MKNPNVEISADLLQSLQEVSVPTATHYLFSQGFANVYPIDVHPMALQPGQVMVGLARTLRFIPKREDLIEIQYSTATDRPHRNAIESIEKNEILVIDACSNMGAGVVGDMFTRRVQNREGTGIVIDGVVRDLSAIKTVGLPVYCRGSHGAGINRELMSVGVNQPIQVGGVPVIPGDVLLGDEDGLVVIPPTEVTALVEHCIEHDLREEFIREKLDQGYPLHQAYPPDEELMKEYGAWKKRK